jgi:hypothetical protein
MRPQLAFFIAGSTRRDRRTPLSTFTSKKQPVLVRNVLEILGLEDAEIVDQDFDARILLDQRLGHLGLAQVTGKAQRLIVARSLERGERRIDRDLAAAIDDDTRAFGEQLRRDGVTDAGRAAGDEGEFVVELEIHGEVLYERLRSHIRARVIHRHTWGEGATIQSQVMGSGV